MKSVLTSLHCPACGAGIGDATAKTCAYCHTAIVKPVVKVNVVLLGVRLPALRTLLMIWAVILASAAGFVGYSMALSRARTAAAIRNAQDDFDAGMTRRMDSLPDEPKPAH